MTLGRPRKLSEQQRQEIMQRLSNNESESSLAHEYNVSQSMISRIRTQSLITQELKEKWKMQRYERTYGLSLKDFSILLQTQNNQCRICGISDPKGHGWVVDHCHKTDTVRGVLCGNCNVGLGHFQDNVELLRKAANYIERHCEQFKYLKNRINFLNIMGNQPLPIKDSHD